MPSTVFVAGSIRATALSPISGIQTVPSFATVPSTGAEPTGIVATTLFVAGSMRATAFPRTSETQTAVSDAASQAGASSET